MQMIGWLREVQKLWDLDVDHLSGRLPRFCRRLSAEMSGKGFVLHIRPFLSTFEVDRFLRESLWCEQVFVEDIGVTPRQFEVFCRQFYRESAAKELFVRFLNHRVGCLV